MKLGTLHCWAGRDDPSLWSFCFVFTSSWHFDLLTCPNWCAIYYDPKFKAHFLLVPNNDLIMELCRVTMCTYLYFLLDYHEYLEEIDGLEKLFVKNQPFQNA